MIELAEKPTLPIHGVICSALDWWEKLPMGRTFDVGFKQYLRDKYYPYRKISSFSEKEIEFIYLCEVNPYCI